VGTRTHFAYSSNHTYTAFAEATIVARKHRTSAGMGTMNMANSKHSVSEVPFSLGLVIVTVKGSSRTHPGLLETKNRRVDPFTELFLN